MIAQQEPLNRGRFLAGSVATLASVANGEVAIAASGTPDESVAEIPTTVAAGPTLSDTWWEIYRMWNPAIQRFPGSYLGAIMRNAENGSVSSLEYLKDSGHLHQVQYLLRMRADGDTIFPPTAAPFAPPLTAEPLAMATKIPSGDESLTTEC